MEAACLSLARRLSVYCWHGGCLFIAMAHTLPWRLSVYRWHGGCLFIAMAHTLAMKEVDCLAMKEVALGLAGYISPLLFTFTAIAPGLFPFTAIAPGLSHCHSTKAFPAFPLHCHCTRAFPLHPGSALTFRPLHLGCLSPSHLSCLRRSHLSCLSLVAFACRISVAFARRISIAFVCGPLHLSCLSPDIPGSAFGQVGGLRTGQRPLMRMRRRCTSGVENVLSS